MLSGGGSSQVYPEGLNAVPGLQPTGWPGPVVYFPSSPMKAIQALAPGASVTFVDGKDPAAAARAAAGADVALVFLNQWTSEIDRHIADASTTIRTRWSTRSPPPIRTRSRSSKPAARVLMPWAARVPAILEAWYPGSAGGEAIANLLFGRVNPSGHLPVTFPLERSAAAAACASRQGLKDGDMFSINYSEGAAVGYKWFDAKGLQPLFPFGHGLSYTSFAYGPISAVSGAEWWASRPVHLAQQRQSRRHGGRPGLCVAGQRRMGSSQAPRRIAKVNLAPGASRTVAVDVDPRLLATFDEAARAWRIAPGSYTLIARRIVARSARQHDGHASGAQSAGELAAGTGSRCPSRPAWRARSIRIRPSRGPAGSTGTGAPSSTASATAS